MGANYPDLAGRNVLVTGGATGIGAAIVRAFHGQGAVVAFLDLDEPAGRRLAGSLTHGHFSTCDLRNVAALQQAIARLRAALGPFDVLVNNAARDDRHAWEGVTAEYWDERFAVNLRHQFFAAQALLPDMIARGRGAIVNMGSISWRIGQGGMAGYTAAKAAVEGLTRSLARDLGPHGIRVNTLAPGWIITDRQRRLWLTPEGERELLERQCLKRQLVPSDVARVVLFLASDEASACTNQTYVVDGGWT